MAGYNNYSKSNNALDAEDAGLLVASQAAKKLGVSTDAITQTLEPAEWHHTSSHYNKTNYYDLMILDDEPELLDRILIADKKIKASAKNITVHEDCTVRWIDWSGSRNHPTATKRKETGCKVTIKGKTATIQLPNGIEIKKRLATRGFSFHH